MLLDDINGPILMDEIPTQPLFSHKTINEINPIITIDDNPSNSPCCLIHCIPKIYNFSFDLEANWKCPLCERIN